MAYEQQDDTLSLFRNDRASKDTDASHTGSGKVAGIDYWVNAWVNATKDGRKYFRIKLKAKVMGTGSQPLDRSLGETIDDEIPF